jgi:Flp pilus assembly protein TadD
MLGIGWGGKVGTTVIAKISNNVGELELARRDIENLLTKDPANAHAYRMKGVYQEAVGDLKGAVSSYKKAIDLDGTSAASFINMAGVLRKLNDLKGAIEALRKAEHLGSHNELVYLNLSLIYREQGRKSEADRLFGLATEMLEQKRNMLQADVLASLLASSGDPRAFDRTDVFLREERVRLSSEHPIERAVP